MGRAPAPTAPPKGYLAPPELTSVQVMRDGTLVAFGRAEAGANVRLADPEGQVASIRADEAGHWRLNLGVLAEPRMLSLSMASGARVTQAQGYVLILPGGRAVRLRTGGGSEALGEGSDRPQIWTVDFDSQGGVVVSGASAPGRPVEVAVDGVSVSQARAGADGRFVAALDAPLGRVAHEITVANSRGRDVASVNLGVAPGSLPGEVRDPHNVWIAARDDAYWRIDWLTPVGPYQATLVRRAHGAAR